MSYGNKGVLGDSALGEGKKAVSDSKTESKRLERDYVEDFDSKTNETSKTNFFFLTFLLVTSAYVRKIRYALPIILN